ncbi:MAG TPA: hypothetical protein ENH94_00590 [Phycisphaerales bacterium]|nr:hypothetical protein [Phycisphaerales bacterium]
MYSPATDLRHGLLALLRQSVYSRLAGDDETNDAERMSVDPAMRQVVGGRAKERTSDSTSLMGRFETEILTQPKNMELLKNLSGQWVWLMIRISEKPGFQMGTLVGVRQRNDSPWPNSCFDYYFGGNSLKMKMESLNF